MPKILEEHELFSIGEIVWFIRDRRDTRYREFLESQIEKYGERVRVFAVVDSSHVYKEDDHPQLLVLETLNGRLICDEHRNKPAHFSGMYFSHEMVEIT